jgi:hypothetical protein
MPATRTPKPVSPWLLGAFLAYFAGILPVFAWGLWRLISDNTFPANAAPGVETKLLLNQGQLLLAVMLAGGIGSYIHGVSSFVTYVGNRSFVNSWAPWYLLRPFMGIAMSVVFYVVVRGGVLVMSGGVSSVDPYAMMTVAALAGMFSKQASDKLAEVFDTLFRSRADAERADKLETPELKLADITPARMPAGSADTVVTATGTGFAADSVVKFDKMDRTATFKSATELTFTIAAAELAAAGEHTVAIHNPASGGATSNERKFTVTAVPAEGAVGTTVQVPAVVTENEEGDLEIVSVADETAATSGAGAAAEADGGSGESDSKPDENGAFG